MNPYLNTHFFSFFSVLLHRIGQFLAGDLSYSDLAPDEIQLIVIGLESVVCALLGVWLSLRKMTMLANAMSHTILLGIVAVYILFRFIHPEIHAFRIPLSYLILAALATGLLTTYLVTLLTSTARLYEDASIGLVFTSLFALSILWVNVATRNAHIGIEAVMGNPDALLLDDIKDVVPIFLITCIALILFYRNLLATSFDPLFSTSFGLFNRTVHYGLMVLVSLALIGGFRAIGVIMVLAFLTAPPLMVRPFIRSVRTYLFWSASAAFVFAVMGVALSRHLLEVEGLAVSTGGLIVTLLGVATLVTLLAHRCLRLS